MPGKSLIIKISSLILGCLLIAVSVYEFKTNPNIGRLLGKPVGAVPGASLETPNPITPSIQGFSNDLNSGSAVISYPIDLPSGPGGLKPNLSLSYSSSNVDDMHVGIGKDCSGADTNGDGLGDDCYDWQETFYSQASWLGLGWNLAGLGFIARKPGPDSQATPTASKDDEFFLVFAGGSARLINNGNGTWETDPKLFLKIEHQQIPTDKPYTYDTAPWTVTTTDGTKYYFGQPINADGYFLKKEGANDIFAINHAISTGTIDYNAFPNDSLATAYTLIGESAGDQGQQSTSKIIGSKWMLRKVEDINGNLMEYDYETRLKWILNYGQINGWSSNTCYPNRCPNAYIQDITPKKISWGKNLNSASSHHFFVEFNKVYDRLDFKIKDYLADNRQNPFSKGRLADITVKTDNTIIRRYNFSYQYSQPPVRSKGSEITWGNLLLNRITLNGKSGQGTLPPYTFSYYTDGNNRFNNTLLSVADNGYGGKVNFYYEGPHKVFTCTTKDKCVNDAPGVMRNRLARTKTEDGMGNWFETKYQYLSDAADNGVPIGRGFVDCNFDSPNPCLSSFEFLGYNAAEVTISKFNDAAAIASRTKVYFYQIIRQPDICFNVDPRRGKTFKSEIYRPDGTQILAKSETDYGVNPDLTADNRGGLNCRHLPTLEKIPAYISLKQEDNYKYDFIPASVETHTRTTYGPYDNYGNLLRKIDWGDVNRTGDEKTTHLGYYPNTDRWILGRPAWQNFFQNVHENNEDVPDLISQVINYYDGSESAGFDGFKKPPTKGMPTMVKKGRQGKIYVDQKTAYDNFGNSISQTDALGNTSTITYDSTYHLYPISIKNPLGHEIKTDYDYLLGLPIKITDPNQAVTEVAYDGFGRKLKVAKQPDTLASPTFTFAYRDTIPTITKTQAKIDEGKQSLSYQIVNGLGQAIQSRVRTEINGQIKDLLTTNKYDSLGRTILVSQPYEINPDTADFPDYTENLWGAAAKNKVYFDDLGRTVKAEDALGRSVTTLYNGWTTTVTDANGRSSSTTQDAYGKNLKTRDPQGNETLFEYDGLGNLTKMTTPASASLPTKPIVTLLEYDALGRKTKMTDPDMGQWLYQYDNNSNITAQTDAKNNQLRLEYDKLNRLNKKIYPDGKTISFVYDQGTFAVGKLAKMIDLTGSTESFYDQRGQLIREKKTIAGESAEFAYAYNNAGAPVSTKYPDGEIVTNTYNQFGQLKQIAGENKYLTNVNYNVLGAVSQAAFGNQTETQFQFDLTGRLKQILTKNPTTDLIKWNYTQDPTGNITKIEDLITTAKTLDFTYDNLGRLKTASGFYTASYNYDPTGNMLKKVEGDSTVDMTFTDPLHAHAPKVVNGFEYKYDANGNLIEDEARLIEWDYDNKPIKITMKATGVITEFAYDGNGQRVIKKVLGEEVPTPTITTPPANNGDFDSNGIINIDDLNTLISRWFQTTGDLNNDQKTNEADLTVLLSHWGNQ